MSRQGSMWEEEGREEGDGRRVGVCCCTFMGRAFVFVLSSHLPFFRRLSSLEYQCTSSVSCLFSTSAKEAERVAASIASMEDASAAAERRKEKFEEEPQAASVSLLQAPSGVSRVRRH
jgi:hypothetical protein